MAGNISRQNGKLGGRPKGLATVEREKAKDYIASRIADYMPALFDTLIERSLKGDIQAIKELFDRAWGKSNMSISGIDGKELVIRITGETAERYGLKSTQESSSDSQRQT